MIYTINLINKKPVNTGFSFFYQIRREPTQQALFNLSLPSLDTVDNIIAF